MTDEAFINELYIRAYIDQIAGYPLGHPSRKDFKPTLAIEYDWFKASYFDEGSMNGPINRGSTLDLPCYHKFTAEDRAALMERE